MTEPKRPLKVFLCHAHADNDSVRGLYARLTKDGVDAWLDKEKLLPGQDWELEIRKAVREADVVVVCLSKQFNQAGFRQKEVRLALDTAMEKPEGEIFIIPARLEECETLESLKKWHWVDLFEDNGYEMLVRALRARADKIGATLQIKSRRTTKNNLRENKIKPPLPISDIQLSGEIIVPVASPIEDFISYLRNYFTKNANLLLVSLGAITREERLNNVSSEWQTLLFKSKVETETINGKEVKVQNGENGEKIGVFSVSKLSHIRSKLRITHSEESEEFSVFVLNLIQQLRDDSLIDGEIRGLSRDKSVNSVDEKRKEKLVKGVDVNGDISANVIVTGSGNVINLGEQKTHLPETLKRTKSTRKPSTAIIVALIGLAGTIISAMLGSPLIEKLFSPIPVATASATTSLTSQLIIPSMTIEPSQTPNKLTPTESLTSTATALPTEITDVKGASMLLVPAGKFTMGSNNDFINEKPAHFVNLSAYYIDKFEVTNGSYNFCVQEGKCKPPTKRSSTTQQSYFGNPSYDNYPVIYVTWEMAHTYCEWRDARLPSEAEWEKAARGIDGRIYPWGDTIKDSNANYNGLVGDPINVGKYDSGVSPYGLFDMAGNVQEWVSDWYQENYYSTISDGILNPQGPLLGQERVLRSGSWDAGKNFIRTSYRFKSSPSVSFYNIGFRCAKDATP